MRTVSIIGLGYFGKPLGLALKERGFQVKGSTRSAEKVTELNALGLNTFELNYPNFNTRLIENAEILVLNIPPFENSLEWMKSFALPQNLWVIFISSTSGKDILLEQEAWVKEYFNKWTIVRFSGLYGGGRHPGNSLSGKKNLKGQNWPVNLIHRDDCVEFIKIVIDKDLHHSTYTLTANEHPTRKDFYTQYCLAKGLPIPEFDPEDESQKKPVSNDEMRKFFNPRILK